ncbi:hypothetical protein [Streptomyces sp. NPDC048508]|uniref:hypothetical protein n=1 Tax=Streptomyces sp. NPDC048508 TaxID=3365561 RepID=UPI003724BED0
MVSFTPIQLNYMLEDHFAEEVEVNPFTSEYWGWASRLAELNRLLEQQALRFADPEVRQFLEKVHGQIDHDPVRLREAEQGLPIPRYRFLCDDVRTVMGTVLRRQMFPTGLWINIPDEPNSP